MSVKDYNVEPELNVSISGISIAEGCAPSGINDALRQLMADVKAEKDARDAAHASLESAFASADASLAQTVEAGLAALDASAVHTAGNETIAGTKTFSATISGSVSGKANAVRKFFPGKNPISSCNLRMRICRCAVRSINRFLKS